jgi:hypothetical protein
VQRIAGAYLRRGGPGFRSYDAGNLTPAALADSIVRGLGA